MSTTTFGPYDNLYNSRNFLWPETPGRMVKLASDIAEPGKGLDLGCGDGKNLVFLEKLGWEIDGVDISPFAIRAAHNRIIKSRVHHKGNILTDNVTKPKFYEESYDLVISYGLYHCLTDLELLATQSIVNRSLKKGGLFAFAIFNNEIPLISDHHTDKLYLRPKTYMLDLLKNWNILKLKFGFISENHYPLVGHHQHSLTWGLFQKPF